MEEKELELNTVSFTNPGFVFFKMPERIRKEISDEIDSMISENFVNCKSNRGNLAGQIKKEFLMKKSFVTVDDYLSKICSKLHFFRGIVTSSYYKRPIRLQEMWVNFQEKGEMNPTHSHTGKFSFVYWHKIPYLISDEKKHMKSEETTVPFSADFYFTYQFGHSLMHEYLEVDKSKEGTVCIFPSALNHGVLPFYTSDEYRISVSGNLE